MNALQQYETGALVKTDPLPPGRYWIDIFGTEDVQTFTAWHAFNSAFVKIEKTEHYEPNAEAGAPEGGDFVIFVVSEQPVAWGMAPKLGWPSTAGSNVQSAADTIQAPPPEPNFWEQVDAEGKKRLAGWVPWAIGGTVLVLGGAIAYAATRK